MNRFNIVQDGDMFFAVATRRFVNLATGKEIAKGLKSGLFSYKDTLEQKGTAWIFQGSVVKNSTIHDDVAVCENSQIDCSSISGKINISNSNIDSSVMESHNISSISESRLYNFRYYGISCGNGTKLQITKSQIFNMYTNGKVSISDTNMVATTNCILKDGKVSGCTLVGKGIEIENSNICNIQIDSHTHIFNSVILLSKYKKVDLYSNARNHTYFFNAKISSLCDFRKIVASNKAYFVYKREDGRFGITISNNKKKSFDFLKEFADKYVFEKNYFKVENDFFCQIKDNVFLQKIIKNEMLFLQKHIKEFSSAPPEKKKKIEETLFFDLITFAIQDQDNIGQRNNAFALTKLDIKEKTQEPGNFFLFSTLIERELAGLSVNCMLHCYEYLKNNHIGFNVFSLCI